MHSLVRNRSARIADGLAIATAVSLPWSTSIPILLIVFLFVALALSLNPPKVWETLVTPAGGLPVALVIHAACGMVWSTVSWRERLGGLDSFFKLLMIPL